MEAIQLLKSSKFGPLGGFEDGSATRRFDGRCAVWIHTNNVPFNIGKIPIYTLELLQKFDFHLSTTKPDIIDHSTVETEQTG